MIISDQPTIFASNPIFCRFTSPQDRLLDSTLSDQSRQTLAAFRRDAQKTLKLPSDQVKNYALIRTDYSDPDWNWQAYQVLGEADCRSVDEPTDHYRFTNALITPYSGLALCLWTADCQPITLFDSQHKVLALAHLGWQATMFHLLETILQALSKDYGTDPRKLKIYIGPSIAQQSYVFDKLAQAKLPRWQKYLKRFGSGWGIDLLGYNLDQLIDNGIQRSDIEISSIDTARSGIYESHYRHTLENLPRAQRFLTVSMLLGD